MYNYILLTFYTLIFALFVFVIRVCIRSIKNPEKSLINSAISILLEPLRFLKLGPFSDGEITLDKVLKYAEKKAKLVDFGDQDRPNFIDYYKMIMNCKEYKDEKFTNLGYIFARNELNLSFVRRLKFVDHIKKNPDILKTKVSSPVFVMGLPRTGTTFLHRLLSLDPNFRAPYLWELLNPVPGVSGSYSEQEINTDRNKRAAFIRKLLGTRKQLGDSSLDHIHDIDPDKPEECLIAMTDELPVHMQFLYADYMNSTQFLELDANKAYLWYKKVLQLLSYQLLNERENPKKWMLKCPLHLFYIKCIKNSFPDAKIIWTHRHPISAVPSMCSLIKSFHKFYYEPGNRNDFELGKRVSALSAKLLMQASQDIESTGLENAHIIYNQLIKDPKSIVKSIYSKFNWKYSEEYDKILDEYLIENQLEREAVKKEKSKSDTLHSYSPQEFGLTEDELCSGKYAEYIDKFSVPMSKN